jgi:hypothetical protein
MQQLGERQAGRGTSVSRNRNHRQQREQQQAKRSSGNITSRKN